MQMGRAPHQSSEKVNAMKMQQPLENAVAAAFSFDQAPSKLELSTSNRKVHPIFSNGPSLFLNCQKPNWEASTISMLEDDFNEDPHI